MTFSARDHARELIVNSARGLTWREVYPAISADLDEGDDIGAKAREVFAELDTAQVTVTWPEPRCCEHCPEREDQR